MEKLLTENFELVIFTVFSMTVVLGIFVSRLSGSGRHSLSLLLLVFILYIACFFFIQGSFDESVLKYILFVVAGFAGGLLSGRDPAPK